MEDFLLPDEDDGIIRTHEIKHEFSKKSLGVVLFEQMEKFEDKICQIDSQTGLSNTYGELLQQCIRTALEMTNRGIQQGDIVCICSSNTPQASVPYIAGLFVGARVCALDPIMSHSDMKHLLNQVPPNIVFTTGDCQELLEHVIRDLNSNTTEVIVLDSATFEEFLKPKPCEGAFEPCQIKDVYETAVVFFSSGTTGLPKGICINHYSLLTQSSIFITLGFNLNVNLGFTSLYWVSAVLILIFTILYGGTRLLCRKFDPQTSWYIINKYKVTMLMLSSTQGHLLLKSRKPTNLNFEDLRYVLVGGSYVSTELFLGLQYAFPNAKVTQGYGCTEIGGIITMSRPNSITDMAHLKNKPRSCGKPVPGVWYKVVDVETEEILKPNQKGELRLKTQYQMNGYYNMDSSNAWDSQGWIKTGDICYYDEEYCFYVVDRIKELIKYRRWHVSPALLEGILLKHPAVEMAVVIGVPHKEDDEHPLALVTLANGFINNLSEDELRQFVNNQVDDNKKLRGGVKIIHTMPQTPSGKVKKNFLKKQILSQIMEKRFV